MPREETTMKKRGLAVFLTAVLMISLVTATAHAGLLNFLSPQETVTISAEEYERLKQYEKLDSVLRYIDMWYYEETEKEKLLEGAIQGMLYAVEDPYTFYYAPEDWKTLWENDEGEYAGIGLNLLGSYLD